LANGCAFSPVSFWRSRFRLSTPASGRRISRYLGDGEGEDDDGHEQVTALGDLAQRIDIRTVSASEMRKIKSQSSFDQGISLERGW
jgi:hypothetical protein